MVAGHILNNAFSQDESWWNEISSLVIEHFYLEKKLFEGKDLVECLNVSMTNFIDTMIDYPNAKKYASGLFKKLHELELLTEQEVKNYEAHVENLENFDDYWTTSQFLWIATTIELALTAMVTS